MVPHSKWRFSKLISCFWLCFLVSSMQSGEFCTLCKPATN
eukprot:06550.XXX_79392_79511_1 [CDS] Oithona nana genome sequencing.